MNRQERAAKAAEYKHSGYNCSQAVALACADLTSVDAQTLTQATAGFGGGMGCMEATCGSLIGANVISGLALQGQKAVPTASMLLKNFREKSGAVTCKDLKGIETGVVLCPCDDCVHNAVIALCETMGIE